MNLIKAISCALVATATTANAGLVFGESAESQFIQLQADLSENYLDFESAPANTNLNPGADFFGVGARFASIIQTNGTPFGPEHVEISNRHSFATLGNSIVGSPCGGCSDDGRVGYEVAFDQVQRRAGLLRAWNTFSITRFYNAAGDLLAEHRNTENVQFVGWMANSNDESTWVARIVMDGLDNGGGRQVGHSDDLYFGRAVPAPAATSLFLIGLATMTRRKRN
jgi:hypothetical protein